MSGRALQLHDLRCEVGVGGVCIRVRISKPDQWARGQIIFLHGASFGFCPCAALHASLVIRLEGQNRSPLSQF